MSQQYVIQKSTRYTGETYLTRIPYEGETDSLEGKLRSTIYRSKEETEAASILMNFFHGITFIAIPYNKEKQDDTTTD